MKAQEYRAAASGRIRQHNRRNSRQKKSNNKRHSRKNIQNDDESDFCIDEILGVESVKNLNAISLNTKSQTTSIKNDVADHVKNIVILALNKSYPPANIDLDAEILRLQKLIKDPSLPINNKHIIGIKIAKCLSRKAALEAKPTDHIPKSQSSEMSPSKTTTLITKSTSPLEPYQRPKVSWKRILIRVPVFEL